MMDAALIIDGVVDTVWRNAEVAAMPEHPTGQWVEAPAGEVFGGFLYDDGDFTAPEAEPAPDPVPVPNLVASGVYTVNDGWIESIGAASGIAMVFPIDVGTYWLFFSEAQPDLSYAAYVSSSQGQINVSSRAIDYLELCVKDGGALTDPSEFSVNIVRSL